MELPRRLLAWMAALAICLPVPAAWSQALLNETFSASSINQSLWEYSSSAPLVSFTQSAGRLQYRSQANSSVGPDMMNFVALKSKFAVGSIVDARFSVKLNYQWSALSPSAKVEGVGFQLSDVEVPPVTGRFEGFLPGIYVGMSSTHMSNGGRIRYLGISMLAPDSVVTPLFYAEEIGATGVFVDAAGAMYILPPSGPATVHVSYNRAQSMIRISFVSASDPLATAIPVTFKSGRPVRLALYGVALGPTSSLTGSRSWIDDAILHQGAMSFRPEGLTASQGTSLTAVNLSWTAASGATSYRVYRTSNLTTPIATVSGTSYADTSAVPGVPTEYCVRAFSATAGLSEHGDFVTGSRKAPVPTVTAVTPASGPLAGGTTITVTGTGFVPGLTTVKVGTATATTVVVNSARTSLTAKTPAGTAGAKSVSVTTSGGTATKASAFTYVAAPTVSAVSPAYGPLAGNTSITVTGTNLAGATVKVGTGTATTVVVNSAGTSLTAKTPAGTAGAKTVTVTTAGGTATKASAFTYLAVPTIGTVTPASGPTAGNTTITVTGTGFKSGQTTVKVGTGTATTVVVNSAGTSLTAKTPAGTAGAKTVTVTTPGGTATKASAFTYTAGAGMPTPPGGGTGGGTDGGSSSAGMSTAQGPGSVGGGSSAGAGSAGGRSARSTWLPDTGIPALDGYLVLSGAEATVGSGCGDAPASDLDADGEADLCQLRRGDLDLDGDVDAIDADLVMLLVGRESADGIADLDGDGWVTPVDAAICLVPAR
jgi:hypothetical protein